VVRCGFFQRVLWISPPFADGTRAADVKISPLYGWFNAIFIFHGSLNVPIEHHPTIRYMVYNGYYKVMSNIPKMGQLPTPVFQQVQRSICWDLC